MNLYFFDIVNSGQEVALPREQYEGMTDEQIDRSSLPLTGPYVAYADYLALEAQGSARYTDLEVT